MKLPLWKKILFSVVVLCLLGVCVEIVARLFLTEKHGPEAVVPRHVGQFDARLGWSLKPNAHGVSRRTGAPVEYRINSRGLRGPERPYEKPKGVFRIVLVGDSRTFGFGVPIEKHFALLLEGYFQNVEAINLGVCGYGVDQELLRLRDEGFRYEPDLVIAYVAHYADHRHMTASCFGTRKLRFQLAGGKLVLTGTPIPDPAASQGPPSVARRIKDLLKKSKAVRVVLSYRKTGRREEENKANRARQYEREQEDLKNESYRRELYELGEAIVAAMHQECEARGATFVLITQIAALHEAAGRRGIVSLDVAPCLNNARFLLPDDLLHTNESGGGALAWEIARFLQARKLVPPAHHLEVHHPSY